MKRRRWLQTVLSAPAIAALPGAAEAQEQKPRDEFAPLGLGAAEPVAERGRAFFTDAEFLALTDLARAVFPAMDGKPGAIEARVPEFLDFYIGQSTGVKQGLYRNGLAAWQAGKQDPAFLLEAKEDILRATFNSREWDERAGARRGGGSGTYYLPAE